MLVESSSKLPAWRAEAVRCASGAVHDSSCDFPLDGPIWVRLTFHLQVPKRRRDAWPIKRPDVDKLTRAALDALTIAGVWRDDSQVAWLSARKVWALGDARTDVELGEL